MAAMSGPILCMACTRLSPGMDIAYCQAYPVAGIPEDILDGGDHRTPRGDETDGLVFNKAATPGATVAYDAWLAMNAPDEND